jgi:hypothetical protein
VAIVDWHCRLAIHGLWIADWHTFTQNVRAGSQSAIGNLVIPQSAIESPIGNCPIGNRQSKSAIGNRQSVNLQSAIAILQSVRAARPL